VVTLDSTGHLNSLVSGTSTEGLCYYH